MRQNGDFERAGHTNGHRDRRARARRARRRGRARRRAGRCLRRGRRGGRRVRRRVRRRAEDRACFLSRFRCELSVLRRSRERGCGRFRVSDRDCRLGFRAEISWIRDLSAHP